MYVPTLRQKKCSTTDPAGMISRHEALWQASLEAHVDTLIHEGIKRGREDQSTCPFLGE